MFCLRILRLVLIIYVRFICCFVVSFNGLERYKRVILSFMIEKYILLRKFIDGVVVLLFIV